MSGVRDLLDRFRPAAAPGAAGPVGVPTDRRAAAVTELEPVFAALAEVERTAAAIRRTGRDQAARIGADAARQAQAIMARARSTRGTERADAAAQIRSAGQAELTDVLGKAERGAARLRDLGRTQVPIVRQRVVDLVRAELSGTARAEEAVP